MAAQAAAILRSKRKRLESEKETASVADGEVYIQLANQLGPDPLRSQVPNTGATKRRATTRPVNGDKFEGSSSANVILYVGLGMVCIGLIITFVGIGDKGFQTLELKLIGPSLVGFPACFSSCFSCCGRSKKEETEGLLAIDKIKMENSLSRTLTTNRVRSVRHPVTGVRRVERTRQDSDSDYEARTSRPRPKLKAARVGKTVKREDKHSDSESSTFSASDLTGSTKNLKTGGLLLSAEKLES